jgi:hypothetical protein
MSRRIVCGECEPQKRELLSDVTERFPEEAVRLVGGKARIEMRCDECNNVIEIGDRCMAVTLYRRAHGFPFWEHEYLSRERERGLER